MDRLYKAAKESLRTLEVRVTDELVDEAMWKERAWDVIVELRKAIKHSQKIADSLWVGDKDVYSPDYAAHLIQKCLKDNNFLPGDTVSIYFVVKLEHPPAASALSTAVTALKEGRNAKQNTDMCGND